jgi:hypothetical protein
MLSVRAMPPVHAARSGVQEDPNLCLSVGVSVVGRSHMRRDPPTAGVLRPVLRVFFNTPIYGFASVKFGQKAILQYTGFEEAS